MWKRALINAFKVPYRRATKGSLRPTWSLLFELVVETIRSPPYVENDHTDRAKSLREARKIANRTVGPIIKNTTIEPVKIRYLECEWIYAPSAKGSERVIYFLHGGGYFTGSVKMYRGILSKISHEANAKVFAINYRLAPETKFPGALEDAIEGYQWLLSTAQKLPEKITFLGDSAGGGLCLSLMLALKRDKIPLPSSAMLISPWCDLTCSGETIEKNKKYDMIGMHPVFPGLYVNNDEELENPLVSPVFADLSGLPPLLVHCGEVEIFNAEIHTFAEKAKQDGVDIVLVDFPDMIHCFQLFWMILPIAVHAIEEIGKFIREKIPDKIDVVVESQSKDEEIPPPSLKDAIHVMRVAENIDKL
eukprot:TRINITY_DN4814_c0_g1_i1.p1 TRINITY_DN4814_c0_g1~~TRINITY_DN4814_c0_g1_i1.p1  ORF type:complete len:362 (-),score=93.79 TRINITY_DN4814_c0_g1_i1:22-1107(-)